MRYSWRKIGFFKHFSFSCRKTNFSKFSFVIDDRFDRKISEPIANNLSTVAELEIAVLNLLNFCNHASFLWAGKQSLVILSFALPTLSSNLFPIVEAKFSATNYSAKNKKYFVLIKWGSLNYIQGSKLMPARLH